MAGLFSVKTVSAKPVSPPAASWPDACGTFARCRKANRFGRAGRGCVVRGLPECARPRAQQRGRANRPRIDRGAQQSGHGSGRGRPHSAVIALGGIPNKVQVGDMGVDGRIFPVSSSAAPRKKQDGELSLQERWYPIQVKQKDKAGRRLLRQGELKQGP